MTVMVIITLCYNKTVCSDVRQIMYVACMDAIMQQEDSVSFISFRIQENEAKANKKD